MISLHALLSISCNSLVFWFEVLHSNQVGLFPLLKTWTGREILLDQPVCMALAFALRFKISTENLSGFAVGLGVRIGPIFPKPVSTQSLWKYCSQCSFVCCVDEKVCIFKDPTHIWAIFFVTTSYSYFISFPSSHQRPFLNFFKKRLMFIPSQYYQCFLPWSIRSQLSFLKSKSLSLL